ncbi:hypothetical protein DL96DRAFT_1565017 [Flagelloscypha sp. PMI_526]|nr:hypothetical protein DL96DRAFT_1565017 [Flagelloscypha sp. PMI_526]
MSCTIERWRSDVAVFFRAEYCDPSPLLQRPEIHPSNARRLHPNREFSNALLSTSSLPKDTCNNWVCPSNPDNRKLLKQRIFQKRVRESGPALVAILYAIPEIYQIVFAAYKVIHGGWGGIVMIVSAVLVQLVLRGAFRWGAHRRGQVGIMPI